MESSRQLLHDCVEIAVPGDTYRLTASKSEVVVDGDRYCPSLVSISLNGPKLLLGFPAKHPLAVRAIDGGLPRNQTTFRLCRVEEQGLVLLRWRGELVSVTFDGSQVVFRIESLFARMLQRKLPSVVVSRSCQHRLFDSCCRLKRDAFTRAAAIMAIDEYEVTVNVALDTNWASGGEFVHLVTGERIDVVEQRLASSSAETTLRLQAKPYRASIGDKVEVSAGCDHEIVTCHAKFNNVANFGGFPQLRK